MKEQVKPKDFQKLKENVDEIGQELSHSIQQLDERLTASIQENQQVFLKKIDELRKNLLKEIAHSETQSKKALQDVNQGFSSKLAEVSGKIKSLEEDRDKIRKTISTNTENIKEQIKTQEDIIMSMIRKFDEQYMDHKNKISQDLDALKEEVDTLKISFTVNESKLLEKMRKNIAEEMRACVRGKESEILMKLWIDELTQIIKDFEKLKKMKPQEFTLQIQRISETIQAFKQELNP